MRKLKIYLAGAMSGLTYDEYSKWRKSVAEKLRRMNKFFSYNVDLDIIDPSAYYNFEEKRHETEREAMNFDLRHVKSSDLVIVNFNKPASQGTTAELSLAYDRDIPIIGVNETGFELHPWDEAFCDRIFDNMDKMIEYVEEFYLK